jgi:hypothetical protein
MTTALILFPPNSRVLEKGEKWSKTALQPMAGTRTRATRASLHAVSAPAPSSTHLSVD